MLTTLGCHKWGPKQPTATRVVKSTPGAIRVHAQTYSITGGVQGRDVVLRVNPRAICQRTHVDHMQRRFVRKPTLNRGGRIVFRVGNVLAAAGLLLLGTSWATDSDPEELSGFETGVTVATVTGLAMTFGPMLSVLFHPKARRQISPMIRERKELQSCPPELIRLPANATLRAPWGASYDARVRDAAVRFAAIDWARARTTAGQPWSVIIGGVAIRWAPSRQEIEAAIRLGRPDTTPPSPPSPP